MSQYYPNFVERVTSPDGFHPVSPRGPAPIQTARVSYTIVAGDLSGDSLIGLSLPGAFIVQYPDANWTMLCTLETNSNYQFQTTAAVITFSRGGVNRSANVLITGGHGWAVGDVLTLHFVAFHD